MTLPIGDVVTAKRVVNLVVRFVPRFKIPLWYIINAIFLDKMVNHEFDAFCPQIQLTSVCNTFWYTKQHFLWYKSKSSRDKRWFPGLFSIDWQTVWQCDSCTHPIKPEFVDNGITANLWMAKFLRKVSGSLTNRELTKLKNCITRSSCRRSSWPFNKNMYVKKISCLLEGGRINRKRLFADFSCPFGGFTNCARWKL